MELPRSPSHGHRRSPSFSPISTPLCTALRRSPLTRSTERTRRHFSHRRRRLPRQSPSTPLTKPTPPLGHRRSALRTDGDVKRFSCSCCARATGKERAAAPAALHSGTANADRRPLRFLRAPSRRRNSARRDHVVCFENNSQIDTTDGYTLIRALANGSYLRISVTKPRCLLPVSVFVC